ncbi:carboxylic acid reductase [Mycolicibacterium hippocampi]|uniref:Carboxylic acid reductase n=1 Tax=Mycolicibacterium hippocampi TaxID=659824 RepID=A0A7I9ZRY4_9MYCO|nr:carboxylic acid reductase [Mycolicibacterium hippocampi]GFH03785.1 oxidoreductase [Mycolicibacterium hippocampi]
MLVDGESEKLARKVSHLLANDPQFVASLPDRVVCEAIVDRDIGWVELMRTVATGYADRPALGQRATELVAAADGRRCLQVLPRFDTITYAELWSRVTATAAALADGFARSGDRIATLGFCSVDYTTIDMAVPMLGGVSVPLHAGAPAGQLLTIVEEAQPSVIACSAEHLDTAVTIALDGPAPNLVIVFDYDPEVDDHSEAQEACRRRLAEAGSSVVLETLAQAIDRGAGVPTPPDPAPDGDRLAVIVYTSGSSGSPKGAMHSESLAKSAWTATAAVLVERGFALPAITLNYMPMSHTAGRAMLYATLGSGGIAYFAGRSDLSTILDDLALVRPTQLNFVPRVWEMVYSQFTKERQRRADDDDETILADLRTRVLGGRFITALTGSAPISDELAEWVERLLDSHLMNALGATESGSVVIDGKVQKPPVIDYKLADVPELGYFSTDRPHPRGELLIKSRTLFSGYYKRAEITADVFDEDGFFRTGDVVAETGPDEVRFVDRRNNVIKLSQGEFVTVSKLEALFINCRAVEQIYVYGNSERSYLLAVVVPSDAARSQAPISELKPLILRSLREAARSAKLEPYEIPRDILVELEPFTLDNGLLGGVRKPSRPNLKKRYSEPLEQLYAEHAEAEGARLAELRAEAHLRPAAHTVCAVASALLGTAIEEVPADAHFSGLGGDSLSALTFANQLASIFELDVPVGTIISPASDMQSIADYIETHRLSTTSGTTFESVHGPAVTEVDAGDLTLDKFIDVVTIEGARTLEDPHSEVRTVLLTGATGYLGRYLLLDWLSRMESAGGKVICLIRAKDDASARGRLDDVFDSGDPALLQRYGALASERLEVLAGDKSEANLGLDAVIWERLAETVDLIVDPAALVNHMLPYRQLFGPNVVGTAELIKLALSIRQKPIAFVSSVGVGAAIPFGQFNEDADVRRVGQIRRLDDNYATGYATSKWAGEVLLRQAHDLCGLPVTVFRCDMIMADPRYRGQLNLPDMVTRLILSIGATGLAPESFYLRDADGGRPRAHFDGLSVDFVADAVSTLTVTAWGDFEGFRTFHVVNPHDDGVGLDTFVDWMVDYGVHVERIDDYVQWLERFEIALRNLPEKQRQASLLPLLASYRHPQPPVRGSFAPTDRFRTAVSKAGIGVDGEIPGIDRSIIEKYVSDLECLGLLTAASRVISRPSID